MRAGDYVIELTATDDNGCDDTYSYAFEWTWDDGGLANSHVERDVCFGEVSEFVASIPDYYTENYYYWNWPSKWDAPASVDSATYVSGGGVTENQLSVLWNYDIETAEVYYRNEVQDGNQGVGVYCVEEFTYDVTIHNVDPPILETPPANLCPFSTVRYDLSTLQIGTFDHLEWTISDAGTPIAGGTANDNYVTVYWNNISEDPFIRIDGFDEFDCSDYTLYDGFDFVDAVPPALTCQADVTHVNTPTRCDYTFQTLTIPTITDNCGVISSYNIDGTTLTNANGRYDVGTREIVWEAFDPMGNRGECSFEIEVTDNEPPTFTGRTLIDTTVIANASCQHFFTGTKRDASVTENCPANTVTLVAEVYWDSDGNGTFETHDNPLPLSSIDGYTFKSGRSQVTWTANDNYGTTGNSASVDFVVFVKDETPPVIDGDESFAGIQNLPTITGNNDAGFCYANLSASVDPPGVSNISDNCTLDGSLVVEFVSRSDGAANENVIYNVGPTTITWRVSDLALPANRTTATQIVTVTDNQRPWFDIDEVIVDGDGIDPALQDVSIGYCKRNAHKLRIPVPVDNCQVNSISYSITGPNGFTYTETITRATSANFNPYGDGMTKAIDLDPGGVHSNAVTGSDYTVIWSLADVNGNVSISNPADPLYRDYSYTLHVEIEPYFNRADPQQLKCGNSNDGKITVVTATDYRVEPGYDIDYTIYNWETIQTDHISIPGSENANIFSDLSGGDYDVQMRVNGCYSGTRRVNISSPAVYDMSLAPVHPYCYEGIEGTIDLTLSGGAAGQIHFADGGAGVSADDYDAIDLTSTGSIEAWVYLESLDDAVLVSKGGSYSLRLLGGKFTINIGGAWWGTATTGAGISPVLKRWYYVVGTWNTSGPSMHLYIDGADQAAGCSIQGTLSDAATNTSELTIGADFAGIIRGVSIWDIATSAAWPPDKYTGSEDDIVAYWTMDNGSGSTAPNSCSNKNTEATVLESVSWDSDEPQPGTYTWTKNGVFESNDIDLTGLGRGIYQATFRDPFGCPEAPGLQRSVTLTPTDAQKPNIAAMPNITLNVDPGKDCQRVVTAAEANGLRPAITDACDIESIIWQVTPEANPIPQIFPNVANPSGDNFATAVLEVGRNLVEVNAYQYNGTISQSAFYYIDVVDNIPPLADGLNGITGGLSNDYDPMGSGIVYFDAFGFNEASDDNCSDLQDLEFDLWDDEILPAGDWAKELSFDCLDINKVIPIRFRVTDEAGLSDEDEEGNITITIVDNHDPVFLPAIRTVIPYEICAEVDAIDPEPDYVTIPLGVLMLNEAQYSDNCNVTEINYSLDHDGPGTWGDVSFDDGDGNDPGGLKFYVGDTNVSFQIIDSSGNDAVDVIYRVTVLPKPIPAGIN